MMAKLHGLLAVQLALLSGEHERQQSVSIPSKRNTRVANRRCIYCSLTANTPQCEGPLNSSSSASSHTHVK